MDIMTKQDVARIATVQERAIKIGASPSLCALFDLTDRICMLAMRTGHFDIKTSRLTGPYEPWGLFIRDLKNATDAAATAGGVKVPPVPAIPDEIDQDLCFTVKHFAALAGVRLPASLA